MQIKYFINKKNIKKYTSLVKEINQFYQKIENDNSKRVDEQLLALKENTTLNAKKKTIQAMAWAKKASKETMGMTYYDVQLMGALALVDGAIAEMKTGEGKTLTCSAAVAANYVLGYSTHVATANEYLAKRDEETLRQLYSYMGISSYFNLSQMPQQEKREAYNCSVVYSTAQELGFDFLRDNLLYDVKDKVQPLDFSRTKCIIDEADFVLIDEARTPLIISGESPLKDLETYELIKSVTSKFKKIEGDFTISISEVRDENGDFWLDEKQKNAYLSERGYDTLEKLTKEAGLLVEKENRFNLLPHSNALYDEENSWIINEAVNALKAQYLYIRDKDYVVQNNQIVIVDPNTGRLSEGRSWSNGLHQAIESKENLKVNPENLTLGTISIQNYFRTYCQISGMSGTVMQSSEEFEEIYQCKTLQIPTNKPVIRKEYQDRIYLSAQAKYKFMLEDIIERHKKLQPILVGTVSVAESEIISELLTERQIPHNVLNAKNNALEAQIVAQAGQPAAVTVATSMAGRGTDIILGGNKESIENILDQQLQQIEERINFATVITQQLDVEAEIQIQLEEITNEHKIETFKTQTDINALYDHDALIEELKNNMSAIWNKLFNLKNKIEKQKEILNTTWSTWRQEVLQAGGLCVIGSSRNESRRIDDQLRGRAGRQGDPGESVFYMSIEDPWVMVFGKNPLFARLVKTMPADQMISAPSISKVFAKAQKSIESYHFDIRKNTFQYDSIADEGRKQFLAFRSSLLENPTASYDILYTKMYNDLSIINTENFLSFIEDKKDLKHSATISDVIDYSLEDLYSLITEYVNSQEFAYSKKENPLYSEELDAKIKDIINIENQEFWQKLNFSFIRDLDKGWTNHLSHIDEAQKNVGFSSLVQKNPIHEYRKICFESYSGMLSHFQDKLVVDFFNLVKQNAQELEPTLEKLEHSEEEDIDKLVDEYIN